MSILKLNNHFIIIIIPVDSRKIFLPTFLSFLYVKLKKVTLQGKSFTKSTNNGKTIFEVNNSPILKIKTTPTTFHMFIDKDSFIDYGT